MRLDHVNIRAANQEAMRDFLMAVLGAEVGERPPFTFPGYWLYLDEHPVIHLSGRDDAPTAAMGCVDHVAFGPFDFDTKVGELEERGREYTVSEVPGRSMRQIFVTGPEGIVLELQCPTRRAGDR